MEGMSAEIQAFAFRRILQIIRGKGCSYDEAWDIFKNEMMERLGGGREKPIRAYRSTENG